MSKTKKSFWGHWETQGHVGSALKSSLRTLDSSMYRDYLEGMDVVKMKKGQAQRNPALGEGKMGHMFVW